MRKPEAGAKQKAAVLLLKARVALLEQQVSAFTGSRRPSEE